MSKNKVTVSRDIINFLESGQTIEKGDEKYMNFPFWLRIEEETEEGIVCETFTRSQIHNQSTYKQGGLMVNKYKISKSNGDDVDPNAWYFVLRIDKDPHARVAAMSYAISVKEENPTLSKELMDAINNYQKSKT